MSTKIRVFILDDSSLVRATLSRILTADPDIEVVGSEKNGLRARVEIEQVNPDVVTVDMDMPSISGLDFLKLMTKEFPIRALVVSSLTQAGSPLFFDCIQAGALDFILKPDAVTGTDLLEHANEIRTKVKAVAKAPLPKRQAGVVSRSASPVISGTGIIPSAALVAIGASTGGTEAIRAVLEALPKATPPIVIVIHMPAGFTAEFAKRLDSTCKISVKEAKDGEILHPGTAYVAPGGDRHMRINSGDAGYKIVLEKGEKINLHRPSVDPLFESVGRVAKTHSVGVILTGMSDDGARGLVKLKSDGGRTIGQDEATCVVYGMPKAAMRLGGVQTEVPLGQIAHEIMRPWQK